MKMKSKTKLQPYKSKKTNLVIEDSSTHSTRDPLTNHKLQILSEDEDGFPAHETSELGEDSAFEELTQALEMDTPKSEELLNSPYVAETVSDVNVKKPKKVQRKENERTIFVGNVDMKCGKRKLFQLFSKYGTIEAIRFRSVAPAQPEVSKREAVIKKNIHASRNTCNAYIRFKSKDMMEASLEANGEFFLNKHLRVDRAIRQDDVDRRAAVFVGNLPFECEEEEFYKHFEECGDIASVRIIRDEKFASGKGFGYVNFKSSDAVEVALQLDGKPFLRRNLRIQRCVKKMKHTRKERNVIPREGEKIGFMKLKGERMSLKFMKKKKNSSKKTFESKKQRRSNKPGKKFQIDDFTGEKMMESGQYKKMKKRQQGLTKEEKKKRFISRHLTGTKQMKKH